MYFSLHGFNISITVPGVVTSLSGEEESLEGCGENSMHLSGGDFSPNNFWHRCGGWFSWRGGCWEEEANIAAEVEQRCQ